MLEKDAEIQPSSTAIETIDPIHPEGIIPTAAAIRPRVPPMSMPPDRKLSARVNRVVGQVEGIRRMVDEGRYCVEVLNQIAAARSVLDALGVELLSRHLETCVLGHGAGTEHEQARPMAPDRLVEEVRAVLARLVR